MIVAVDFDGTLCEDKFPFIGEPKTNVIACIKSIQDQGMETILWTCRVDNHLKEAVDWCNEQGLKFTAVNDNTPTNIRRYGTNPRKVFADVYIDDKSTTPIVSDIIKNIIIYWEGIL